MILQLDNIIDIEVADMNNDGLLDIVYGSFVQNSTLIEAGIV